MICEEGATAAGKEGDRHRGFTKITRAFRVGHFADDKRMTDNDPSTLL